MADDTICNWEDAKIGVSIPIGDEGVSRGSVGKGTISSAAGVRISKPLGIGEIGTRKLVSALMIQNKAPQSSNAPGRFRSSAVMKP